MVIALIISSNDSQSIPLFQKSKLKPPLIVHPIGFHAPACVPAGTFAVRPHPLRNRSISRQVPPAASVSIFVQTCGYTACRLARFLDATCADIGCVPQKQMSPRPPFTNLTEVRSRSAASPGRSAVSLPVWAGSSPPSTASRASEAARQLHILNAGQIEVADRSQRICYRTRLKVLRQ